MRYLLPRGGDDGHHQESCPKHDVQDGEREDLVSVARLRSALPELPAQTRARLEADHGLDCLSSARLVEWPSLLEYFELCVLHSPRSAREVSHLVFSVVQGQCLAHHVKPRECGLEPKALVEASNMKQDKLISASGLQEILGKLLEQDKRSVEEIVREENLYLVKDENIIKSLIRKGVSKDCLRKNNDFIIRCSFIFNICL